MRIKLSGKSNKYVQVDKKWYLNIPELSLKWHKSQGGYARRSIYVNGKVKSLYMARLIYQTIYNTEIPKDMEIEHRDQNKLNNTRKNLRLATVGENHWNMPKIRGKSRYKGCSWHKRANKWQACSSLKGKKIFLGYYIKQKEAARAYDRFAKKHHGQFKCLNNV